MNPSSCLGQASSNLLSEPAHEFVGYWPTIVAGIVDRPPTDGLRRMDSGAESWVVVVPVKGTRRAKSRLQPLAGRAELATAFALDTVTALQAAERVTHVFVVTGCRHVAATMRALGAVVIMEDSPGSAADPSHDRLNSAISRGRGEAQSRFPQAGLAVFTGDLPSLTADDVDEALALTSGHDRSMIPDAEGTGTTALFAQPGVEVTPRFGRGSRLAHEGAGHVVLAIAADSRIRRDVDEVDDLGDALALGVGSHTGAVLSHSAATQAASIPVTPR